MSSQVGAVKQKCMATCMIFTTSIVETNGHQILDTPGTTKNEGLRHDHDGQGAVQ
jgi:hypothetical protein